ncbi:TIGR03364 family FAD-dependent oxidoreductase [Rathayibacter sp. VKM Ac-2856]|uniref:TIGR03364 family FAD-dependent oxidoreductase n=1 Tax=unclassified Rathayibacter TaxID=2609250 RepID=UPI0015634A76|nr:MULTISPECIES: TIGR03364 family FAD-dependent oxidoreductase [unclassified Rathayibacter]NQX03225.1 TIGR03364 family FAD-dependent oxidoreductase [Rathayibacter sp. VKM Ac-2858]NQX18393.1 TIGR03364 family FAD-dependent oxidoreductase [Rathayibacter sp. VKM Ac-2856]
MSARYDVAVVGSGIVGLGAAYAAVRRGLRVVVLDRTAAPMGSTVRNFGHLCFTPQSGEALRYGLAAREAWLRLSRDAGVALGRRGTHIVARHADELALLEAAAAQEPFGFGDGPEIELLDAREIAAVTPVDPAVVVGGAVLPYDLQADPRTAAAAIVRHLAERGVEFRMRTAVGRVAEGVVETSRGAILADTIVVAVNHDLDQLLPELAEAHEVVRCSLDMLRVQLPLRAALAAPLLTGWSLVRYSGFARLPEAAAVRARLHADRPDLAAIDLNQMYTQLPDGSVVVGDSHHRSITPEPFQSEATAELLLEATARLFGAAPRVLERWQGVYASGRDEFLVAEPIPGVLVRTVTTGIGMTTGLGLAETTLAERFERTASLLVSSEGR